MATKFLIDQITEDVKLGWLEYRCPSLFKALINQDKQFIKNAIKKLQETYPSKIIKDLRTALFWIETERQLYNKKAEQLSLKRFPHPKQRYTSIIKCSLNGRHTFALIDTGSERSFIGLKLATQSELVHKIDFSQQWVSSFFGVGGSQLVIGRIHVPEMQFSETRTKLLFPLAVVHKFNFNCIVFGLDILKWFQGVIDYENDSLTFKKLNACLHFLGTECPCFLYSNSKCKAHKKVLGNDKR